MTLTELRVTQRASVQQPVEVNLFRNPSAVADLFDAEGNVGLTSLARQVGGAGVNAYHGTAFRLNGKSTENDSYMFLDGSTGAIRNGMQAGRTYQARGRIYLPAALTGTANSRARRIVVFTRIGAGAYVETASAQAPNVAGTTDLAVDFTVPVGASEAFVRFYHGHASTQYVQWHSLMLVETTPGYVSTGYWDGDYYSPAVYKLEDDLETGWDGEPHQSTSWYVDRAQNAPIPDAELEFTLDTYAVPFITGRITAPTPSAEVLAMLDPRRSRDPIVNAYVQPERRTAGAWTNGTGFPSSGLDQTVAKLWVRELDIDEVNRRITLTVTSGEVRLDDKIRVVTTVRDTGAATVADLVEYAIADAGEAAAISIIDPPATSTAVPAGDRREHGPGESNASVYESELAALGMRLWADDFGVFTARAFDSPPNVSGLGNYEATDGDHAVTGRVYEARRKLARAEWADAAIVKADYQNSGGTRVTTYQRHLNDGASSRKGIAQNIARAMPSGYAQSIAERSGARGESFELRMMLDYLVRPGKTVRYHRTATGDHVDILITRVTYRPTDGLMDAEGVTA